MSILFHTVSIVPDSTWYCVVTISIVLNNIWNYSNSVWHYSEKFRYYFATIGYDLIIFRHYWIPNRHQLTKQVRRVTGTTKRIPNKHPRKTKRQMGIARDGARVWPSDIHGGYGHMKQTYLTSNRNLSCRWKRVLVFCFFRLNIPLWDLTYLCLHVTYAFLDLTYFFWDWAYRKRTCLQILSTFHARTALQSVTKHYY